MSEPYIAIEHHYLNDEKGWEVRMKIGDEAWVEVFSSPLAGINAMLNRAKKELTTASKEIS